MVIAFFVNVGMWFERFVIVISSLTGDYLPSSWDMYWPTAIDVLTLLGSFGLFFTLFLLFIRWLPMVAMAEVKAVMHNASHGHDPEPATKPGPSGDRPDAAAVAGMAG